jgi:hypothetical protein
MRVVLNVMSDGRRPILVVRSLNVWRAVAAKQDGCADSATPTSKSARFSHGTYEEYIRFKVRIVA